MLSRSLQDSSGTLRSPFRRLQNVSEALPTRLKLRWKNCKCCYQNVSPLRSWFPKTFFGNAQVIIVIWAPQVTFSKIGGGLLRVDQLYCHTYEAKSLFFSEKQHKQLFSNVDSNEYCFQTNLVATRKTVKCLLLSGFKHLECFNDVGVTANGVSMPIIK